MKKVYIGKLQFIIPPSLNYELPFKIEEKNYISKMHVSVEIKKIEKRKQVYKFPAIGKYQYRISNKTEMHIITTILSF